MSPGGFLTVATFVFVLIFGIMLIVYQDLRATRPEARIKARMVETFSLGSTEPPRQTASGDALFAVDQQKEPTFLKWIGPKLSRLKTVAGVNGLRIVVAAFVLSSIGALLMVLLLPLPSWSKPLVGFGLPLLAVVRSYSFLVNRFTKKFLDGFPDLIDMIVRAVRAGVPVTHVIGTAAAESDEPVKTEFKIMSDSLQVGRELDDVLTVAMKRIDIPDFSFFCVCLLLQRETGGQLGETLENLSNIVRTRREVRQKTKSLTAEARITTKILAAVPIFTLAGLYTANKDYVMVLFNRESGHKLLTFAVISVVFGIMLINKMSKLDTSR